MQALSERVLEALRGGRALSLDTLRYELDVPMLKLALAVKELRDAALVRPEGGRLVRTDKQDAQPVSRETPETSPVLHIEVQCGAITEAAVREIFAHQPVVMLQAPEPTTTTASDPPAGETSMGEKTCTKCKQTKPQSDFYTGQSRCKRCLLQQQKEAKALKAGKSLPAATPAKLQAPELSPTAAAKMDLVILQFHDGARIGRPQISAAGFMRVADFVDLSAGQLDELCTWWQQIKASA